jgi:hypothetical protein
MSEKTVLISGFFGIGLLSTLLLFLMLRHEYTKPHKNLMENDRVETYQNKTQTIVEIKTSK